MRDKNQAGNPNAPKLEPAEREQYKKDLKQQINYFTN